MPSRAKATLSAKLLKRVRQDFKLLRITPGLRLIENRAINLFGGEDIMISAWHLLWIVPASTFSGLLLAALLAAAGRDKRE